MKILVLSDHFPPRHWGGAEKSTYIVVASLRQAGASVEVLSTVTDRAQAGSILFHGIRVHYLTSNYPARWQNFLGVYHPALVSQLRRWCYKIKPDIVQVHNIHDQISFKALEVVNRCGIPVVFTAHDAMTLCSIKLCVRQSHYPLDLKIHSLRCWRCQKLRYNPWRQSAIRRYLNRHCQVVFCNSKALAKALRCNGIQHTMPLYNGIDIERFVVPPSPSRLAAFRLQHGLPQRPLLLHAGRLNRLKGTELMLAAFARVLPQLAVRPHLLLVGAQGDYQVYLAQKASRLGIIQAVSFAPWLTEEEMRCAYELCDIVVVPSIYLDAFPRINLEAGAWARPVIGTTFGGTPEIIKHGQNGFLVNPYNIDHFAKYLYHLIVDPHLRTQMGKTAREQIQHYFRPEDNAAVRLQYYRSLLSSSAAQNYRVHALES